MSRKYPIKAHFLLATSLVACILVTQLAPADASPSAKRYDSIFSLKTAFLKAGGQCWEWKLDSYVGKYIGDEVIAADCDNKTRIIFYRKNANVLKDALRNAELSRSIGYKVNILVGPNWMINSDQVNLVYRKLGGTLITR